MGSLSWRRAIAVVCAAVTACFAVPAGASAAGPAPQSGHLVKAKHSYNGSVRNLPNGSPRSSPGERPEKEGPALRLPTPGSPAPAGSGTLPGPQAPAPSPSNSFEGLHFSEDCGGTQCGDGHPPDTNGDVGPQYYVETVNTAVGIYDKATGTRVAAFSFNALMSQGSFGNLCDTDNFGDPVVVYDSFHDRWIISDFAFTVDSHGNIPNPPGSYQCFAVSKTGDPVNGGWNFFSLHITDYLNDYPKFGVWPDGLYMSANMFGFKANGTYKNPRVWALNLAQMEAGNPTPQVVTFDAPSSTFTLLPSNARVQAGTPPAGRPDYFVSNWGVNDRLQVWRFHVDWANTANSTFTGPSDSTTGTSWALAPSTVPSGTGGNPLDSLNDRLMVQNQYTNIGGVESLWDTHAVQGSSASQAAVRWYQLPVTSGTVGGTLTQASTWNPDTTTDRWMSSVAVDRVGDMAIGYSVSGTTLFPGLRYAARLAGDPVNTLSQSETSLMEGTGTQTGNCGGSACERWGDYSAMTLDPDGCTFWYTNEYYVTSGLDDHTRIGSFQLPGCTAIAQGALHGTVTDAVSGNPISGAVVSAGIYSTTTDGTGAYSFPSIAAGSYNMTASEPNHSSGSANNVAVTGGGSTTQDFALEPPPAPDHLTITSSTANLPSGTQRTITAEVRDQFDHLIPSDNSTVVTFSQSSGTGTVTGLGTATASGGVASKTITGAIAGPVTIAVSATGLTGDSSSFSVTPGAASKLVFTSLSTSVSSGSTKSLTVEIRDAANNLVNTDNSTSVTFAKTSGAGSVTGLGSATASGGVATKTVTGALAGSVTVTATSGSLASDSSTFSVTPGSASQLAFTSTTASVASGQQKTLSAAVQDAAGNLVSSDNSTLVTFSQTGGAGSVTGLGGATASGGIASISVTGSTAGSITASAQASGLTSASSTFSVTPGTATQLVFTSDTTTIASGAPKTLTAEVRDAANNLVTSDNSTAVVFTQTAGTGSVTGLTTATASGGVATDTVMGAIGGSVTITAAKQGGGLTTDTSTFTVSVVTPTKVVFTSSPASVASGQQKTLTVELRDATDTLAAASSAPVTFTQTSGSGTVTGLGTVAASGGVATLQVTGAIAGPLQIRASAPGLTPDSSSFAVIPGAPDHLVFTSTTADLSSGAERDVTLDVRDASNNRVGSSSTDVSLALVSGAGSLGGVPASMHALGGVATFPVTGVIAGPVQVQATASGMPSVSTSFNVVPGAASQLAFTSSTANLASGVSRTLTAEVRDANGNKLASAASVAFAKTGGAGTVTGLPASVAASAGVASSSVTGFLGGPITITASSAGLGPASTTFTIAPGPVKRSVTLKIKQHVLSGKLRVTGNSPACRDRNPVQIQMRPKKSKRWKIFKRVRTARGGGFTTRVSKVAAYRALVAARPGCGGATSRTGRLKA